MGLFGRFGRIARIINRFIIRVGFFPYGHENRKDDGPQDESEQPHGEYAADRSQHNRQNRNIFCRPNGKGTYGVIGKHHEDNAPERQ